MLLAEVMVTQSCHQWKISDVTSVAIKAPGRLCDQQLVPLTADSSGRRLSDSVLTVSEGRGSNCWLLISEIFEGLTPDPAGLLNFYFQPVQISDNGFGMHPLITVMERSPYLLIRFNLWFVLSVD